MSITGMEAATHSVAEEAMGGEEGGETGGGRKRVVLLLRSFGRPAMAPL